jgi:uncharacterized membrane protein YGL010W
MKSLVDHLSQYAAYHRDPRNIASHFIGIPLIVVAVAVLLSRPAMVLGGCGFLRRCWWRWLRRGFTCAWN